MPSQRPRNGDSQTDSPCPRVGASMPHKALRRRGISVVWLIIWVPVLLILSCLVLDVANVWLARVELENGLEASALAAVKEWAETGDNLLARRVGVAYACYNTVRGRPIVIGTNYDAGGGVNQNAECCITPGSPPTGNLIFGAIVDTPEPVTFNAGVEPGCGDGTVLFDASEQGGLTLDNAWGISFRSANNSALRITRIEIDLQASGGIGTFDFTSSGPVLSADVSPYAVRDTSGNEQEDISGFNAPASQITFSPTSGTPSTLTITFSAGGGDNGFAPGDRFRFGARVRNVSSGSGSDDGDGIGRDAVGVTVWFNDSTMATGVFFDSTDKKNDCYDPALVEPVYPFSLIVNPSGIPDLPCPPASAANNNGQSYVMIQGGSGNRFAVRAQARVCVPSLWRSLFGGCVRPHCVTVKTTAVYECAEGRPKLLILDDYICPGP